MTEANQTTTAKQKRYLSQAQVAQASIWLNSWRETIHNGRWTAKRTAKELAAKCGFPVTEQNVFSLFKALDIQPVGDVQRSVKAKWKKEMQEAVAELTLREAETHGECGALTKRVDGLTDAYKAMREAFVKLEHAASADILALRTEVRNLKEELAALKNDLGVKQAA